MATASSAGPSIMVLMQETVLPALDGVAYLVDPGGDVLGVGRSCAYEGYGEFGDLVLSTWVGDNLFDAMVGDEVRAVAQRVHRMVAVGRRSNVSYRYRCDAPALKRVMRMSISRVADGDDALIGLLYQSVILSEEPRPAMAIFDPERLSEDGGSLKICSYCHDVLWTGDAAKPAAHSPHLGEWVSPETYYRRGGAVDGPVSHGVCPSCVARICEEEEAAQPLRRERPARARAC